MKKILILLLSIYGVLGAQTQLDPAIANAINSQCCGGSTSTSSIIYVDSVSSNSVGDSLIVYKNGTRYAYKYPSGSTYTLPIATTSVLGGVKDGSGVLIKPDGTINAEVQTFAQNGSNFLVFTRDTSGTGKIDTFKWVAPDFWRSSVAIPVNANGMPDGVNDTIEFIQHRQDIFIGGADGLVRAGQGAGNIATNTVFGKNALLSNTTGYDLSAFGHNALRLNTTGFQTLAFGNNALYSNTTGSGNNAFGYQALFSNTTGSINVAIGHSSLQSNTTGSSNIGIGFQSLISNISGGENVAIGESSIRSNTTGIRNVGIGRSSLSSQTTASGNTANGYQSGTRLTTGGSNCLYGANTAIRLTTGVENVVMGTSGASVSGFNQNILGNTASANASRNVLIGSSSSAFLEQSENVIIGFGSGYINQGTKNVMLGAYTYAPGLGSGWNAAPSGFNISNNTFIGADFNASTAQQVIVGNNNSSLGYGINMRVAGITNSTAIGANSVVENSNQIQLGDNAVRQVRTFGAVVFQQTYTDANVPNNSMYVDATTGKLFFKDASGVANPLY